MGCYAQTDPQKVARATGADLVFGTGDHHQIVDSVLELMEARDSDHIERVKVRPVCEYDSFQDIAIDDALERTRAFVKIQDGCDQYCTYCKVPYSRGPVRSRPLESVLEQVRLLADKGYTEVVLIGVHLGLYGRDLNDGNDLASVTAAVAEHGNVLRVRLGSVECTEVTPRLLSVISEFPNVCRHLHIPLQSGDDAVLRRMGRPYDTSKYLEVISTVRSIIPECAITTDLMVGFPGETEAEFERSMSFVERCRFTRLHVFGYSRRPGTPAAAAPNQVPKGIIAERIDRMTALGKNLSEAYHRTLIGRTLEILVEGESPIGKFFGHTDTYVLATFSSPKSAPVRNSIVPILVESADADGVYGVKAGDGPSI